jgi:hypothetical protein
MSDVDDVRNRFKDTGDIGFLVKSLDAKLGEIRDFLAGKNTQELDRDARGIIAQTQAELQQLSVLIPRVKTIDKNLRTLAITLD